VLVVDGVRRDCDARGMSLWRVLSEGVTVARDESIPVDGDEVVVTSR